MRFVISFLMAIEVQECRPRRPKLSPLWQCLDAHDDAFLDTFSETYEHDYGFLRPILLEVVGKLIPEGSHFSAHPPIPTLHFSVMGMATSYLNPEPSASEGAKQFHIIQMT